MGNVQIVRTGTILSVIVEVQDLLWNAGTREMFGYITHAKTVIHKTQCEAMRWCITLPYKSGSNTDLPNDIGREYNKYSR